MNHTQNRSLENQALMILNHSGNFEGTCAIITLVVGDGRINPMIIIPNYKQLHMYIRMCICILN